MKKFALTLIFGALVLTGSSAARAQSPTVDWGPLTFLLGDWVGDGTAELGQGSGGTTFAFDLQKRVMIRRNRAEYPATKDRPAYVHDDLMVIYSEAVKGPFRAMFFDNEGHIINYEIQISADGATIVLLSDLASGSPRFRFTYQKTGPSTMSIKFEIAPPGKPDAFAQFIEGKLRRK